MAIISNDCIPENNHTQYKLPKIYAYLTNAIVSANTKFERERESNNTFGQCNIQSLALEQ